MKYYLDLFTPETWAAFRAHGGTVSGFRERQRKTADRIEPGDIFICYLVRLSRWCGILEVASSSYIDASPIFTDPDPFQIRFRVKSLVSLDLDQSIPIYEDNVWSNLSMTRDLEKRVQSWAQFANLRASLRELSSGDGEFLCDILQKQAAKPKIFPLSQADQRKLSEKRSLRTPNRTVVVEVPAEEKDLEAEKRPISEEPRESYQVQALVARIGAEMGFKIWIPRSDKQQITHLLPEQFRANLLIELPLNYDDTTLKTVEQIDVIWLQGRSMARAFEVEHTTSIYSGLLRMADLLALQPNMDIRLHIVAPDDRRDKVLQELRRPVFSLLDKGPLYDSCTFLPYSAVREISVIPHLQHMKEGSIVEDYEEMAQDE